MPIGFSVITILERLKCGILLPKDVLTHGQIYVAFFRYGNPNNIYVWAEQSQFETYNLSKQKKM